MWRDGRADECAGLENRRAERFRGFESLSLRHFSHQGFSVVCKYESRINNEQERRDAGDRVKSLMPESYHVMCKPIGPRCNLNCEYCFYTEKEVLFGENEKYQMSPELLDTYVRKYIESQMVPEINFAWQGGEPTLMGLDFFRRAVALQKRYSRGKNISNSIQTNGILLDEKWCDFLARENFLVGLSVDGPKAIHDHFRVDRQGVGTFDKVMASLRRLKDRGVNYNILTAVTSLNAERPLEVYRFLKSTETEFIQFIPIVERKLDERSQDMGLKLAEPPDLRAENVSSALMPWSVSAEQYGRFLNAIFDEWLKNDVGRIFIQIFDVALSAWMGENPGLCTFSETCGRALAMEHNGDIYACDHFVYPDHYVGNIMTDTIEEIITNPLLLKFGLDKRDALPRCCRECEFLFVCNGECPKNRFIKTTDGEPGLNYLCDGYKIFFRHIDPAMKTMAGLLKQGRPAADIMNIRPPDGREVADRGSMTGEQLPKNVGRNDPCPCGSGRKFKRCCGK